MSIPNIGEVIVNAFARLPWRYQQVIKNSYKAVIPIFRKAEFWLFVVLVAGLYSLTFIDKATWADWRDASESVRNFGLGVGGVFAASFGIFLAWRRTEAASRQSSTSVETHRTELFARSIEMLKDESHTIQVGGASSLYRIARESPKDSRAAENVLYAFLLDETKFTKSMRGPLERRTFSRPEDASSVQHENIAVQTACNALFDWRVFEFPGPDFSELCLDRLLLLDANLEGLSFNGSFLRGGFFEDVYAGDARFVGADLGFSFFRWCNFKGANLQECSFDGSWFSLCSFEGANLRDADFTDSEFLFEDAPAFRGGANHPLSKINFCGADLSGTVGLSKKVLQSAITNEETIFP
ncbi:MAG: pentapeptide repeat-containing protein [Rhodospirillales bacterium]|nr:pentapeptide repeat-containing protein [Rhodospirillales bacterium]